MMRRLLLAIPLLAALVLITVGSIPDFAEPVRVVQRKKPPAKEKSKVTMAQVQCLEGCQTPAESCLNRCRKNDDACMTRCAKRMDTCITQCGVKKEELAP